MFNQINLHLNPLQHLRTTFAQAGRLVSKDNQQAVEKEDLRSCSRSSWRSESRRENLEMQGPNDAVCLNRN